MKNKPFSIVVVTVAAVTCALSVTFLTMAEDWFGPLPVLIWLILPYVIFGFVAVARPMPAAANFLFCVTAVALMVRGVFGVSDYAANHGDIRTAGFRAILYARFIEMIVPFAAVLAGVALSSLGNFLNRKWHGVAEKRF